ncbi:hypothetical protein DH09_12895 [Bacillaceae bacterium JMAK1]|nr:hypothetical protein DH09_12895 [Bacillaceae bacterium JMAK1]
MMFIMVLLTFAGVVSSVIYYSLHGAGVDAFVYPATMIGVVGLHAMTNRLNSNHEQYNRYQAGLNTVITSVVFVLFILLHVMNLNVLGFWGDPLFIVPLSVGFVFCIMGNQLHRFKVHEETILAKVWNNSVRPFSFVFVVSGLLMIGAIFAPYTMILFFIILGLTVLFLVIRFSSGLRVVS